MTLIVTRPAADAARLIARLRAAGRAAIASPLLSIVPRRDITWPAGPFRAIALSSANAARAPGSGTSHAMQLPVFTPGAQSAEAARQAGFTDVTACGGDVRALAAAIPTELSPVLYLSGAETAGDLKGLLAARGIACDNLVLYDAVPAQVLSPAALDLLRGGGASGVLLYSPRTARIWRGLIGGGGLADRLPHYCLSAAVAAGLDPAWPRHVAASPDEDALLAMIGA